MSRSNPSDNSPNPSVRWFEWNGEHGTVRCYDKATKQNVDVRLPFSFVLLDELATVGGWNDASKSSIYANEVRDTRQDVLLVKAFKGGTLAEGLYRNIKDRVSAAGAHFVANCYIAFKRGDDMAIGSIKFKGAALGAWMKFRKSSRSDLYKKAIEISGYTEGLKGRVVYRMPQFHLKDLSDASNQIAVALDLELQTFLTTYFARTKRDQVDVAPVEHEDYGTDDHSPVTAPNDDDIPF